MDKQGKIQVTWDEQDYVNLKWTKREDFAYRLSGDGSDLASYNMGLATASQDLPACLHAAAKNFSELQNIVIAVNKMTPGQVLPFHRDNYIRYRQEQCLPDASSIVRIIVFLHDPAPGHQLWIQDEFCTGLAGSWFSWKKDTPHMAANLGIVNRYVMQITGTTAP